jgi:hypothetical protein
MTEAVRPMLYIDDFDKLDREMERLSGAGDRNRTEVADRPGRCNVNWRKAQV